MRSVKAWVNSKHKDYWTGVQLYERYGTNRTLIRLFKRKESAYTRQKLAEELRKLAEKPKKQNYKVTQRYSDTAKSPVNHQELPDVLKKLDIEKGKLFKEAAQLHEQISEQMEDMPKANRLKAKDTIERNFKRIEQIWADIDYWQQHGELPEHLKETPKDEGERIRLSDFINRRKNVPTYISKAKKELEKTTDKVKKQEIQARIDQFNEELAQLKEIERVGWIVKLE